MTTPHAPAPIYSFTIELDPVPAARPRFSKWGTYNPPAYDAYKSAAAALFPALGIEQPVLAHVEFVCKKPKGPKHAYPSKGDEDNLLKAIYDAATSAGLWKDDMQVVGGLKLKRYARDGETPHTRMIVQTLSGEELQGLDLGALAGLVALENLAYTNLGKEYPA